MRNDIVSNIKQNTIRIILFFVLGIFSGFLAKYVDTIPSNDAIGIFINIIGNITSRIGIWVFAATIIAAWSRTPRAGAMHVFAFFCCNAAHLLYLFYEIVWFFSTTLFCSLGINCLSISTGCLCCLV